MDLQEAVETIKILELEIEKFKKENIRLSEIAIAWKRKAENKGLQRESLKEGYNAFTGMHYKSYEINLPGNLNITAVLDYLKENDLKDLYPYVLRKIDYMPKKKNWIFEVEMDIEYDIRFEEAFLKKYYKENV